MTTDLDSLLAVQADDAGIRDLERQLDALGPRLLDLDREREAAATALARARLAAEQADGRQRDLETRIAAHRQLHERNVAQLESIRTAREATAGMAQVDRARSMLAEEESELAGIGRRIADLRAQADAQEAALAAMDAEQAERRAQLAEEERGVRQRLDAARAERDGKARDVSAATLSRYDRIRKRRGDDALFAVRAGACGSCDTAIPLQRRNALARSGGIDVCEACGALVYAAPERL